MFCFQKSAPSWLVQNEAGLFWRAKGNGTRALQCIRKALSAAPQQHRDVPLLNAANLLMRSGQLQQAQQLLQEALQLNASEVPTTPLNFHCTSCSLCL